MIDNVLLSLALWSTCLSIEQHLLCKATWEPSHWALGPPWGLLRKEKRKTKKKGTWWGQTQQVQSDQRAKMLLCRDQPLNVLGRARAASTSCRAKRDFPQLLATPIFLLPKQERQSLQGSESPNIFWINTIIIPELPVHLPWLSLGEAIICSIISSSKKHIQLKHTDYY